MYMARFRDLHNILPLFHTHENESSRFPRQTKSSRNILNYYTVLDKGPTQLNRSNIAFVFD